MTAADVAAALDSSKPSARLYAGADPQQNVPSEPESLDITLCPQSMDIGPGFLYLGLNFSHFLWGYDI